LGNCDEVGEEHAAVACPLVLAAAPTNAVDELRAYAPDGVEVAEVGRAPLERVEFLVYMWTDRVDLAAMPSLQVVQALSAGTDWLDERVPPGVTLCNAGGARDVPVAEWVAAALLGATTGMLRFAREHDAHAWPSFRPGEVAGSTVVIVGLGKIGQAVRRRLEALRANVVAVGREPRPGVHGAAALPELLRDADAVVILTPLTDETRGLVDASFLAALPDGALVLNPSRGAVVDTGALLAELQTGRLRAVLDVTDPEPLPADDPLLKAPNLIVVPHIASATHATRERMADLAVDNLLEALAGRPMPHPA
jgi:phosphoglycerate dehydrogenase-like enzyme